MGMVDRQEVLKYFSEIEYAAHTQNWLNDIRMARDLFTHDSGLKSIFETGFKRHSEPRLPSTAQINH